MSRSVQMCVGGDVQAPQRWWASWATPRLHSARSGRSLCWPSTRSPSSLCGVWTPWASSDDARLTKYPPVLQSGSLCNTQRRLCQYVASCVLPPALQPWGGTTLGEHHQFRIFQALLYDAMGSDIQWIRGVTEGTILKSYPLDLRPSVLVPY